MVIYSLKTATVLQLLATSFRSLIGTETVSTSLKTKHSLLKALANYGKDTMKD